MLRVQLDPGTLLFVLEDDGREFNPLEVPPPDLHLPLEQREAGGLGIHWIRQLAAHVDYQRFGTRNRLTVRIARCPPCSSGRR
jgi:anti-sigma regulatory factor (Ser/Thr protein kinase)